MRIVVALLVVAAFVAAAVFFADQPGRVEIVWQGWQIDTSVGVMIVALLAAALLLSGVLGAVTAIFRLPSRIRRWRAERARRLGDAALTRALVALAAGNSAAALLEARRAEQLLDGSPLTLLLSGEAAERRGDAAAARRRFAALADRPDTALLGLRGLLGQALREDRPGAALRLAERAHRLRPDAPWLTETLLALQARAGEWDAALETLSIGRRRGGIAADRLRHHRGVVLHEMSRAAEQRQNLRRAAALAARAQREAPDLAAIAAHHARLLMALDRPRAAALALERAWRAAPHPDLARAYVEIHPDASALERAAALERLAAQNPEAGESHLAVAEAALAAQLWGEARRHLSLAGTASAASGPSRRFCRLLARLEDAEATGRARDWLDRAVGASPDPCDVCTACGANTPEWHSACPECGGFDTLVWRLPERSGAIPRGRDIAPLLPPLLPLPKGPTLQNDAAKAPDRLGSGATIG